MSSRSLVLVLALVSAGLLVWLLVGSGGPDPTGPAQRAAADDEGPRLEGRGGAHEGDAVEPERNGASPPPQARGAGRRWILEVEYRIVGNRSFGFVSWDDPASKADATSPFEGREVRVQLQRGNRSTILARGVLDTHSRAEFELPQLGAMSALDRASSRLYVLPEDDDVRLGPEGHESMRVGGLGRTPSILYAVPPARPDSDTIRMRLVVPAVAGRVVTGRVFDVEGVPASNARVGVHSSDGGRAPSTCTDERGRFAFPVTTAGTFEVRVSAADGSAALLGGLRLAAGAHTDLGALRLAQGDIVFAGRITYPDGRPVAGLEIVASHLDTAMHVSYLPPSLACESYGIGRSTRTDAQGRFRLYPGWVGGSSIWSLRPEIEGDARLEPPFGNPDRSRRDLDGVVRGHRLRVRVLDASGTPVEDAKIVLRPRARTPQEGDENRQLVRVHTNPSGRADVWLSPGSAWSVTVIAPGGAPLVQTLDVPASGNESNLTLHVETLDLETGIRVTLRDAGGASLMPAVLRVATPDGVDVFHHRVDEAGYFLALATGRYRVHMRSIEPSKTARGRHRWRHHHGDVDVQDSGIVDVVAVVAEAAHLHVTLRMAAGTDPRSAPWHPQVYLEHEATGRAVEDFIDRPWTGHSGDIVDAELEPGAWTVRLEATRFRSVTRKIVLEAGELGQVEFILDPE